MTLCLSLSPMQQCSTKSCPHVYPEDWAGVASCFPSLFCTLFASLSFLKPYSNINLNHLHLHAEKCGLNHFFSSPYLFRKYQRKIRAHDPKNTVFHVRLEMYEFALLLEVNKSVITFNSQTILDIPGLLQFQGFDGFHQYY